MKHEAITGNYNSSRYEIWSLTTAGQELIYTAGNCRYDSTLIVPVEDGVGIKTMQEYCERTTREFATERSATFGGITQDEEGSI